MGFRNYAVHWALRDNPETETTTIACKSRPVETSLVSTFNTKDVSCKRCLSKMGGYAQPTPPNPAPGGK